MDGRTPEELVKALFAAEESNRAKDMEPILADDFRIVRGAGALRTKVQVLDEDLPRGKPMNRDPHIEDVRTIGNVAVVLSLLKTSVEDYGFTLNSQFWNTHIFEHRDEGWKCVAWQVTRA